MNESETANVLIARLRANLAAAGISVGDADIEGVATAGFLRTAAALDALLAETAADLVPDYLGGWGDAVESEPATVPAGGAPAAAAAPRKPGHPGIAEVAARVRAREVSPVELTEQALARIAARDPALNAFQLVLSEEARVAARQAEREIASGHDRGPLHGIPVAVKDLLTMRGTATTAGSRILADWRPNSDSAGVERLRRAGAVIVGKTRLSEFAYSPGSNNAHYGPTRNPWNLAHDTGGSSSGSGAAVADGLVFAALGSDTGGSIRIPAAQCGLVGLKPSYGRVSLFGAVSLSWSLDHLGPLTRDVAGAAMLLQVLAGHDPRDSRTRAVPAPHYDWRDLPALPAALEAGVRGLRIGVLRDDGRREPLAAPEALAAWRAGLDALEREGAELIEVDLPELEPLRTINGAIIGQEAAAFHTPSLRRQPEALGEFMRRRVLAAYAMAPGAFIQAQQARAALRHRAAAVFARVNLLSTPAMPGAAPPLGVPASTIFTGPFNCLGWPAISVPVGLTADNLPLGLQLVAPVWDEATLLRGARTLERAGPWPGGAPPE